jgi:hypothetical protein
MEIKPEDWSGVLVATENIKDLSDTMNKFARADDAVNVVNVGKQILEEVQTLLNFLEIHDATTTVKKKTRGTRVQDYDDDEWEKMATKRCGRHG